MKPTLLKLLESTRKIGSWSLDVATSKVTWSPGTYAIHGVDPSTEILLETGINYYIPEHREVITKYVEEGIAERKSWDVELQIQTAGGQVRWVRASGTPQFEGETLTHLQGVFEDIDDRKRLEVERETMLRRMVEGERVAKIGYWTWEVASDATEWSPGALRLFGLPIDAPAPTAEEHLAMLHPDDREMYRSARQRAVATGSSYQVEYRLVQPGGHRYVRAEGFPQLSLSGQLIGFEGVVIDRTFEAETQAKIEELNRRLTLALEASQIGVWEWHLGSDELIWDDRMYALYGITEHDFTGAYEAWERGLHPDDKARAVAQIEHAVANGTKFEARFRVVWKDGTVRTIQGAADLVFNDSGVPIRMVGVNSDITELIDIQSNLERSNQELAQFAYRASHDLKSPLTAMRRLASYALKDLEAGAIDEVASHIRTIERRTGSMEAMVGGILDMAKADLSNPAHAVTEPLDLAGLIADIAGNLRDLSEEQDVEVQWDVDCADPIVLPKARILQILQNLITNGVKYAAEDRRQRFVRVQAQCGERGLHLAVEDNGTGIPDSDADTPYEMFRRFHAKVSGSGLGLYIVKKHVEALFGKISFETSDAGTRFELEIPIRNPNTVNPTAGELAQ